MATSTRSHNVAASRARWRCGGQRVVEHGGDVAAAARSSTAATRRPARGRTGYRRSSQRAVERRGNVALRRAGFLAVVARVSTAKPRSDEMGTARAPTLVRQPSLQPPLLSCVNETPTCLPWRGRGEVAVAAVEGGAGRRYPRPSLTPGQGVVVLRELKRMEKKGGAYLARSLACEWGWGRKKGGGGKPSCTAPCLRVDKVGPASLRLRAPFAHKCGGMRRGEGENPPAGPPVCMCAWMSLCMTGGGCSRVVLPRPALACPV